MRHLFPDNHLLTLNAHRSVFENWSSGFIDRDNKFVKEFQTRFNSCFWELYVFACLKQLDMTVDFAHSTPDFIVHGFCDFVIECVTAQNAHTKQAEHELSLEARMFDLTGLSREQVAHEATVRLANAITSKFERFNDYYSKLPHVKNKPFVLAVAPFEAPYFWTQRLDGITNVLYRAKLNEVEKENGTILPLGVFLDDKMAGVSAVLFSNVATFGKVLALSQDKDSIAVFVTARYGHDEVECHHTDYVETLLDGLFLLHNPHARFPMNIHELRARGIAQIYGQEGHLIVDIPKSYLLERSCMNFAPKSTP